MVAHGDLGRASGSACGYLGVLPGGLSSRLGRKDEARLAYLEALMLSENETERTFLAGRLHQLEDR